MGQEAEAELDPMGLANDYRPMTVFFSPLSALPNSHPPL